MALSKYQKTLRAETLSRAVTLLRERLGISRQALVDLLRHKVDEGMIYRWEHGKFAPNPEWRQYLARFARKRGYNDIAAVFEDPLTEWKQVLLSSDDRHLLALFEIVILNKPVAEDQWPEVLPWQTYKQLQQSLRDAVEELKRGQGRKFPPMRGRWGASLLTDEQRGAWLRETHPRAKVARGDTTEEGVGSIRYVDGRVAVREDETRKEESDGKTKKSAR